MKRTGTRDDHQQLASAERHFEEGRFADAATVCRRILDEDASCGGALELLGRSLLHAGQPQEAMAPLMRRLEQDPNDADNHARVGDALAELGNYQSAIAAFRNALDLRPDSNPIRCALANAYHDLGHLTDAVAAYRQVLAAVPDRPDIAFNMGRALEMLGRFEEAAVVYRRSCALDATMTGAHACLGNVLERMGRLPEAAHAHARAVSLAPAHAGERLNLARLLAALGRHAEAEPNFRAAVELDPESCDAAYGLGATLQALGRASEAESAFRTAIERDPTLNHPGCKDFAQLLIEQERLDEAVDLLDRRFGHHPEDSNAGLDLARGLMFRGRFDESEDIHRRVLARHPNHAAARASLGVLLSHVGRVHEAATELRRTIELDPDRSYEHELLCHSLVLSGQREEATAILESRLRVVPDDPIARHSLAAITGRDVQGRATDEYVRTTFDGFARSFDETLNRLEYRAPELVLAAIEGRQSEPALDQVIIDAGCGTGLCGPGLRPRARRLIGVDLSPGMLERAATRDVYDELVEAELTRFLATRSERCDVIVSADTLVYFGDLEPALVAAAHALDDRGLLVFTVEHLDDDAATFRLEPHGRYVHALPYVRNTLGNAGFQDISIERDVLRHEGGTPVNGLVVCAVRGDRA